MTLLATIKAIFTCVFGKFICAVNVYKQLYHVMFDINTPGMTPVQHLPVVANCLHTLPLIINRSC